MHDDDAVRLRHMLDTAHEAVTFLHGKLAETIVDIAIQSFPRIGSDIRSRPCGEI